MKNADILWKDVLSYDPNTGLFYWKIDVGANNSIKAGSVAGSKFPTGHIGIKYKGVRVLAHRLVFFFETGTFPVDLVDHIDGDASNNRRNNLRLATYSQNNRNRKPNKNTNLKGYKNIYYDSRAGGRYRVVLWVNGKSKYIASTHDLELADLIATEARIKYFGEFARHD